MENKELYDIKGYEGYYKINKNGEVFSLERKVKFRDFEITVNYKKKKQTKLKTGYYAVGLWKDNNQKLVTIHSLLAETFIPNPNNYKCINHIDGNKENNNLENLEWCSQSHNVQHAYDNGLAKTNKKVMCVETGIVYKSIAEAARMVGKPKGRFIGDVARGRRKTAYGYHWKFV